MNTPDPYCPRCHIRHTGKCKKRPKQPQPTELSTEALERMIAEQLANPPEFWERSEQHQGRGKNRRSYDLDRLRKPNRRRNTSGGRG